MGIYGQGWGALPSIFPPGWQGEGAGVRGDLENRKALQSMRSQKAQC